MTAPVRIVGRSDPDQLTLAITTDARERTLTALDERAAHFAARVVTDREARHRAVRTQLQPAGHVTLDRQAVSIAADACSWARDTGDGGMDDLVRAWREVEADTPTLVTDDEHAPLPHESDQSSQLWGNNDPEDDSLRSDGGSAVVEPMVWHDLTAFQRDCLVAVTTLATDSEPPHGRAIQERLSSWYGELVHHSRLYQNLDELAERDLVAKTEIDGRTNGYAPTDAGHGVIRVGARRLTDATEGGERR